MSIFNDHVCPRMLAQQLVGKLGNLIQGLCILLPHLIRLSSSGYRQSRLTKLGHECCF